VTTETTSDKTKPNISAVIEDIFEAALCSARQRLTDVKGEDVEDTMSFDRVARTALALVRIAAEVDAIGVRKRKEAENDGRNGAVSEDDINRHEQELARRLARHARELSEQFAARGGAPGEGCGEGGGA
jgi:hypothetical protein